MDRQSLPCPACASPLIVEPHGVIEAPSVAGYQRRDQALATESRRATYVLCSGCDYANELTGAAAHEARQLVLKGQN